MRRQTGTGAAKALRMLTPKEIDILRMLARVRYAATWDVTNQLFSPGSHTYVRHLLAGLSEEHYLYKFSQPSVSAGNRRHIFALGAKGREYLAEALDLPEWYRPYQLRRLGFSHLSHALAVTRLYVSSHVWDRRQAAYTLLDLRHSYEMGRDPALPVIPDVWELWQRRTDGRRFACWLEADNRSEFSVKWKSYLQGRVEFIKSGHYADMFKTQAVLVAYVVAGETPEERAGRVKTLMRWCQELLAELGLQKWGGIFRFGAEPDDLYRTPIFEAPVLYRLDSAAPLPLFPP